MRDWHREFKVIFGILLLSFTMAMAEVNLNVCDRELDTYYVPVETRRGFNALESRGFLHRLRLVVELFPRNSVLNIKDTSTLSGLGDSLKRIRNSLDKCLSSDPARSLLGKAIGAHGPDKGPSETLTKAFSKSLHECLDKEVPELFVLKVDLFADWKVTGWR